MKHLKFIARTALVQSGEVDLAVKALNKVLTNEKVFETARRWQYYEKPYVFNIMSFTFPLLEISCF